MLLTTLSLGNQRYASTPQVESAMPVFKYYDESGKLIIERNEPLSEANLDRFVSENGAERVAAYMQALYDLCTEMDSVLNEQREGHRILPRSPHMTRKVLEAFLIEKEDFLRSELARPFVESLVPNEFLFPSLRPEVD
jgi:hypothetical protein